MNLLSIPYAIQDAYSQLRDNGYVVKSQKWQAVTSPDALWEVDNLYYKMQMPDSKVPLAHQTEANLPWAEDHFRERMAGQPLNPGNEYLNWPYYRPTEHDKDFKSEGENFFSHTYMERFWPDTNIIGTGKMGYKFGNFDNLIERLMEDTNTRQAFFAIWHPNDQSNNGVRVPCTIGYHFMIRNNRMNITYLIRSCDILRHFRNDIYMSIRLAQYVRDVIDTKIEMGYMAMWIGSLHCFNIEKFKL